jgi:hypothetical protein
MDTSGIIRNKVAESGILTLDLSGYIPDRGRISPFDLQPFLFMGMILKEKDYRAALIAHDWEQYRDRDVALFCSIDAVIPVWAYMLAASYLEPVARSVAFGTPEVVWNGLLRERLREIDPAAYADKRVVLKGCGDIPVPEAAYVEATVRLRPVVKSIMYGEPCSTVPVYKAPRPAAGGAA